ncbi:D-tyrosyl-tRNA(Tyr) deacylase [Arthrobacter sp. SPG23]|uniref:D-aminoacyl-tRNA deacylase n=1 Tax=Arthrobacter sp. SPG23 TaxID=1610703 RepID=UPI0005B7E7F6|nr:D-aminoacyl-tRNA deacylase [Arthrobacter sp. SPG23]KIS25994.1 D-tyrosyl-tRNA(Tyr) deacylase [Arthrobacter sp. SPG23]
MRAILQRVTRAEVTVDGETVGSIDRPGLVVLAGATHTDTMDDAKALAAKIWTLRILDGERSCADQSAPLLVVSQFTLYADTRRGRRPSWSGAAPADTSEPLIEHLVASLRGLGAEVSTGRFGAMMQLTLVNDGPFTISLDTADFSAPRRG